MKWFNNLKENYKDINTYNYSCRILRFMISMFEYKNLPNTLDNRFLETYLNSYGAAVIGKINNELYCVQPNLCGDIDAYNMGTVAFGVCPIGEIRGKRDIDVVYGCNNSTITPTFDIYNSADLLANLDMSIRCCIKNARKHIIPVASDNKTKIAIDNAIKNIENGESSTILSNNILSELDGNGINLLNLTDIKDSTMLQYLFHSKDDVIRQLYTQYGQATQGTGKMAQQTEKEIDGNTSMSFIDPYDMLTNRIKMCDSINRIFGTDISVDFSENWKREIKRYDNDNVDVVENENEKNDNMGDDDNEIN